MGLYMPKRNLYLSDDDVELWDELPKGERGRILRDLLLERKSKALLSKPSGNIILSQKEKDRENIILEIDISTKKYHNYKKEIREIEDMIVNYNMKRTQKKEEMLRIKQVIESLESDYNENIGALFLSGLWDEIYSVAKARIGEVYNHPVYQEEGFEWEFRIKSVKNGKIEVETLDREEKSSSFITRSTTEKVEQKLEDNWHGDLLIRIKSGNLLGDYGVECAIVILSTKMRYENESILYDVPYTAQVSKQFSKMSVEECILWMNKEVEKVQNGGGGTGWARSASYGALQKRFFGLDIDTSSFINISDAGDFGMSFKKKIQLLDDKIIQID